MELPPLFLSRRTTTTTYPPTRRPHQTPEQPRSATSTSIIGNQNLEDNNPSNNSLRPSSTTAKHKSRPRPKQRPPKVAEIDPHDVPVPAPDTGVTSVQPSVVRTGFLPIIPSAHPPTTLTVPPAAHTLGAGYPSLLPLSVLATLPSRSATPTASVTVIPKDTSRTLGANQPNNAINKGPNHTQIIIAILVAVGIVFMFLSVFVYWRWYNRPRRRTCPTPSLPIFQDPFADQDLKVDEESLFGGKDSGSSIARPPSNGIYPWVQYTPRPSDTLAAGASKSPIPNLPSEEPLAISETKLVSERSMAPVQVQLPVNISNKAQPIQQMQSALTRAAHRVSAMSLSIYPTSPQSNAGIGIAIGGASPLTGDGTPILTRKSSKDRVSAKARQSFRHSLAATEYLDIYGEAVASPTQPPRAPAKSALHKLPLAPPLGRARIQAGYTPGTANAALRASSTVAGITTLPRTAGNRTSFLAPSEEVQYLQPPLSPALKSDARRERDTRALTSALGLATPSQPAHDSFMPSPVTTLHPDDSITLAGDRNRDRDRDRDRHSEAPMSPGMEASARLGNLMLAEFTNSMVSIPSARGVVAPSASIPAKASARPVPRKTVNAGVRMDDRPPRVPSPPPLPSLAQMAMAHANPQGYEDYRSPTYSIYGLYEGERKCRVQGALEDGSI
ncbi:hypothetical protein LXA43DRAFT_938319 [Ganoderma leucocontextum]|nr:hypothetical protein LXA43DRAFT_938319 [Ganoderma leucocontextum]